MCTAIAFHHCFGRNLDLEYTYGETVTVTPRSFPLSFRLAPRQAYHLAMIGMAYVTEGFPLYYDALNESGLFMAALNFPEYAHYPAHSKARHRIAPFELIPWILGQCATLDQVRRLLSETELVHLDFSPTLPVTPLHFLAADRSGSLVIEPVEDGLRLRENPMNVLTNSPSFDLQTAHLERARACSHLPGDRSSISRFIRAAELRRRAADGDPVTELFHMLGSVAMTKVCDRDEFTRYTACCDAETCTYYYTTYENRRLTGVRLQPEHLETGELISYPLRQKQDILTEA